MRWRWKRVLLAIVAFLAAFTLFGIPYLLAVLVTRAGTRPMDRSLVSTPADYGLEYEEVAFPAADGVALSGWLLPGGSKRAAVILGHGLFRSRREVLDRAAFFRRHGYEVLLFDFRRHGESGGALSTLGYQERLDFEGAASFLERRSPSEPVVLYGVSMGAGAAILAARETPQVAAVIADSPFLDIESTVVHHVNLVFGLPKFPFASLLLLFLEMRAGFDREDFDLRKAAASLGERPILVLAGEEDQRMPAELQRRVAEASRSPRSRFLSFPGAGHGAAYRESPEAYESAVLKFLESAELPGSRR